MRARWRQRKRMQDTHYDTAEADVVGWRRARATHMLAGEELGTSKPRRRDKHDVDSAVKCRDGGLITCPPPGLYYNKHHI